MSALKRVKKHGPHDWKYGERYVTCVHCGVNRTIWNESDQCMEAPPTWLQPWPRHDWKSTEGDKK
jgi:hypothetical protein